LRLPATKYARQLNQLAGILIPGRSPADRHVNNVSTKPRRRMAHGPQLRPFISL